MDYLSKNGVLILESLKKHCKALKMMDADDFELSMLANCFDKYEANAAYCRDNGDTVTMITKTGAYEMMRPQYMIMKTEYGNILKHSGKFGLNPGDREKIFSGLEGQKKRKGFEIGQMKVAK